MCARSTSSTRSCSAHWGKPDSTSPRATSGENVTTRGIDLLALPVGTLLRLGDEAVVEVTGLRNPCLQIDHFRDGLLKHVVGRDESGRIVRKAGIMGVVTTGGMIRPGDPIEVELPAGPHRALERV
ncbi:MOSC domain-containing protein [Streptomyces sp. NPDC015184]|uniref:MOSC domain-containing protein n=1 Tax=Streptomyces sp. NPDC015184 TaxID=3364946 RepID=UPI0036FB3FAA